MDLVEVNVFGWFCWVEFSDFACPQIDGSACSVPWIEAGPHGGVGIRHGCRGFVFFLDSGERAPWPSVEVSNLETSTTSSHYLRRFGASLGRMTACCVLLCLVISSSQRKRSLDNSDKLRRGRLFWVDTMSISSTVRGLLTGPQCRITNCWFFLMYLACEHVWAARHLPPPFQIPSVNECSQECVKPLIQASYLDNLGYLYWSTAINAL